jgi:putative hydrolase of the HAD superfamily
MNNQIKAVFWDFGGVILSSPFDAFNRYEEANGLPKDFIRGINARNPKENAWARLERSDIDAAGFSDLFQAEAEEMGHSVPGSEVLKLLSGDVRPEMVESLRRVRRQFTMACLTNNVRSGSGPGMARSKHKAAQIAEIMTLFHHVVESSQVGVRKPEPRFYEIACETAGVRPKDVVFLDDLGINLKPAKAMGMQTIKVLGAEQALTDLEAIIKIPLR